MNSCCCWAPYNVLFFSFQVSIFTATKTFSTKKRRIAWKLFPLDLYYTTFNVAPKRSGWQNRAVRWKITFTTYLLGFLCVCSQAVVLFRDQTHKGSFESASHTTTQKFSFTKCLVSESTHHCSVSPWRQRTHSPWWRQLHTQNSWAEIGGLLLSGWRGWCVSADRQGGSPCPALENN